MPRKTPPCDEREPKAKRARAKPPAAPSTLDALRGVAQAFVSQQGASFGLAPDATPEGVVLPYVTVAEALRTHDLVVKFGADPRRVYHALLALLGTDPQSAPAEAVSETSEPDHVFTDVDDPFAPMLEQEPAPSLLCDATVSCCGTQMVDSVEYLVCSGCGGVRGASIYRHAPYRYFLDDRMAGKQDPNHWSVYTEEESPETFPEIDQLLPFACGGRATYEQGERARAALHRQAQRPVGIAHRLSAAIAALILEEQTHARSSETTPETLLQAIRADGLRSPNLPTAPFPCPRCSQGYYRSVDLRLHSRRCPGSGAAARATPGS